MGKHVGFIECRPFFGLAKYLRMPCRAATALMAHGHHNAWLATTYFALSERKRGVLCFAANRRVLARVSSEHVARW